MSCAGKWFCHDKNFKIPKSTTQEMLQHGRMDGGGMRITKYNELNFQTYPVDYHDVSAAQEERMLKQIALTTAHTRSYVSHFSVCPRLTEKENIPDPLFNRRPFSDFPYTELSPHKFMDDHFINLSENRKKINFLRQLRNVHFSFPKDE